VTALAPFLRLIWQGQRAALIRGLILSLAVLLAGIALLGLSGWFITAAGMAGLAGLGIAFEIFRPASGVRFLALTRTVARYGERMLTHDATLRVLADWRVRLLSALTLAGFGLQSRLRGGAALNRLTADVDALDGLAIRLVFPVLAGLSSLLIAGVLLWWLVLPSMALWIIGCSLVGAVLAAVIAGPPAAREADRAEAARQGLRAAMIDHLRGRTLLAVEGRLPAARAAVLGHDRAARQAALRLAGLEIGLDTALQALNALTTAGTLVIAGRAVLAGQLDPARAALAFFAALAVAEVMAPLSRAIGEFGRMRGAAVRLAPLMAAAPEAARPPVPAAPAGGLRLDALVVGSEERPLLAPLDLAVAPGETVALSGRSGLGKTTVLDTIAGLRVPVSGRVALGAGAEDEIALRQMLGYLTQRPALTSGTIAEALELALPGATPEEMTQVLEVVSLNLPLDRRLGEAGQGLSGGEARRLALARVLIRRPAILLLDEPTEGLDAATARKVLTGIRASLPGATILIASHRPAEREAADRVIDL
jgi:ATP-binding cassette subfamily C protein CydC